MLHRRPLLALPLLAAVPAAAQTYPARPIRLVSPFPPGGTTDILARGLAAKWAEPPLSAQVVVENRPGGGGAIGSHEVFRAPPDGHTLIVGNNQTHATNAALIPNLPYDAGGFSAVSLLARVPHALVVPANSPARDLAGLVAYAKRRPGGLSYAVSSHGSAAHIGAANLSRALGMDTTAVPYRGAAPAAADLTAGVVEFSLATWASVSALVLDGRLRALAVGGTTRFAELPDVPTLAEAGVAEVAPDAWFGLFAPPATPAPIVQWLYEATVAALADAAIRTRLTAVGFQVETMPPIAFADFVRAEVLKWAGLIRSAGITAEAG